MELGDREVCYRALQSRDARFDGVLFVGVRSTGVYCRPVCPARTPQFKHCRFFPSAAAAQSAGFRPCLRCHPETAPALPSSRGASHAVARALALIADGVLDGDEGKLAAVAERLGLGERQLRRLFVKELGAAPVVVAQTRRVLLATQLIHETRLPITAVALAAGFGSIRRFNEAFQNVYRCPPSALRRRGARGVSSGHGVVTVRIRYRPPYDWDAMLRHLAARAVPGVEVVDDGTYRRTVAIEGGVGAVAVCHLPWYQSLGVTIDLPDVRGLSAVLARVRRLFDTDADVLTIGEHLSRDPLLKSLVAARPGLRAPGGWDGFELAVRAILGQQVTVAAARRLAGQLVAMHGEPVPADHVGHAALTHLFPTAERLAAAERMGLAMPGARQAALRALAEAAVRDRSLFQPCGSIDEGIARLRSIRGIGDWTAQYIALRALREPDAFPATDAGLLRNIALLEGGRPRPARLLERAEAWRPWRAYAAQHLWAVQRGNITERRSA